MPDFMARGAEIKALVSDDNLNRSIRRLLDYIRDFCEGSELQSEAILVSAAHKRLVREERLNTIDFDSANRARNRIIDQVLTVLKEATAFCKAANPQPAQTLAKAAPVSPPPPAPEMKQEEVVPEQAPEDVVPEVIPPSSPPQPSTPPATPGPGGGGPEKEPPAPPPPSPPSPPPPPPVIPLVQPVATPVAAPAAMTPVCYTKNLHKRYRKSGFHLENINLSLNKSEILGVVGENGNGKTTLFKILAGELRQDQGEIHYPAFAHERSGKIDWIEAKHNIAYVSQELPRWYGPLKDNLYYEAGNYGIRGKQSDQLIEFLVHRLGLIDYMDMKWNQLSGGYKLRFSLAKALIRKPTFLVLDEPFANLDVNAQTLVMTDLRDLANSVKYPVSIVISSQHLHEIEFIADKILFVRNGKTVFYGHKDQLGADRAYNYFEIQSSLGKEVLLDKLQHIKIVDAVSDGMYVQIVTPLDVDCNRLVAEMIRQKMPVSYFRDISKSTKKLFV